MRASVRTGNDNGQYRGLSTAHRKRRDASVEMTAVVGCEGKRSRVARYSTLCKSAKGRAPRFVDYAFLPHDAEDVGGGCGF